MSEAELDLQRSLLKANLVETLGGFARVLPGGELWSEPGLFCVYSGMPGAVFNTVLLTERVAGESEFRLKLDYVDAMYRARQARWSLWLLEDLIPDRDLRAVPRLLDRYSARAVSRGAGMFASSIPEPSRKLPELDIERIGAVSSRFDFCHVMAVAFRTPLATFLQIYNNEAYWEGPMRGHVGYSAGRPVATACVMPSAGVLGIYGVSVLPEFQRRGFGESMMRQVLDSAQRQTGLDTYVLEASEAALRLYARLGFHSVTGVTVYNAGA